MDYEYDIFISYPRHSPASDWVRLHFFPLLDQWLPEFMPPDYQPRLFVDWQLETGVQWPLALRQALLTSRCLLPVWSPAYFRSAWCVAEWQSMMAREQLLGMRSTERPQGLIYPVVFNDGEHFPEQARQMQHCDLHRWNCHLEAYRYTPGIVELNEQVKGIAQELAKLVLIAPTWQADWPAIVAQPVAPVRMKLPRFS